MSKASVERRAYGDPYYAKNSQNFYVRLVPLDARGDCVGAPSSTAVVRYGPTEPAPPQDLGSATTCRKTFTPHPSLRITRYRPIYFGEPYHWIGAKKLCKPGLSGTTGEVPCPYKIGQKVFLPPKEKDWMDQVGDALGDVVSFIRDAVNWVSTAYNDIKSFAINLAIKALKFSGLGCGSTCADLLKYAVDYGLALVGLPPSLPNFDQLVSMGKDYLAGLIASKLPGVTDDEVRWLIDKVAEGVKESGSSGNGSGLTAWLGVVPDPEFAYSDAYMLLEARNTTGGATDEVTLTVTDGAPSTEVQGRKLYYEDAMLVIPPLRPGQKFTVPMLLEPARPPEALKRFGSELTDKQKWEQERSDKGRIVKWSVATSGAGSDGPLGPCSNLRAQQTLPPRSVDLEYLAP